jgi:hypothetical protein
LDELPCNSYKFKIEKVDRVRRDWIKLENTEKNEYKEY